jgi:hypothetical protein
VSEAVEVDEKTGRTLTPAEWAEAVTLWELGTMKLRELAAKFRISEAGMSKGLTKRGATKGSRAKEVAATVAKTVLKAAEDEALTAAEERQRKINETKAQHYEWSKMLGQQIMARLAAAQKDGRAFETEIVNIKTLRIAVAGLGQIRQERYAILDADRQIDEDELPTLVIQDLSEAEIERLRSADEDIDGSLELPAGAEDIIET